PQRSCQTSQKTAPLLAHHQTPLLRQTLLGQNQPLPWHEDGAVQMVPLLELPDPLPRVSRVVGGRDRPEGVGRLDDVARRLPSAAGRSSDDAYYEGDSQEEDGQPREHVFVVYRTPVRLVKTQLSLQGRGVPWQGAAMGGLTVTWILPTRLSTRR